MCDHVLLCHVRFSDIRHPSPCSTCVILSVTLNPSVSDVRLSDRCTSCVCLCCVRSNRSIIDHMASKRRRAEIGLLAVLWQSHPQYGFIPPEMVLLLSSPLKTPAHLEFYSYATQNHLGGFYFHPLSPEGKQISLQNVLHPSLSSSLRVFISPITTPPSPG